MYFRPPCLYVCNVDRSFSCDFKLTQSICFSSLFDRACLVYLLDSVCTCAVPSIEYIFLNFIIRPTIYLMNPRRASRSIEASVICIRTHSLTHMIIFSRYQLLNRRMLYFMYFSLQPLFFLFCDIIFASYAITMHYSPFLSLLYRAADREEEEKNTN